EQYWTTRSANAAYNYAHWPMDVNGDGLVDLIYKTGNSETYRAIINKGNGTAVDEVFGVGVGTAGWEGRHWVLDTNGDGIMDLVYNYHGTNNYRSFESQADGSRKNVQ